MNSLRFILLATLLLNTSAFALESQTNDEGLLRKISGGSATGEATSCRASYDGCTRGCTWMETYFSCTDSCRMAYVNCSNRVASIPSPLDPKAPAALPYDRAIKACESSRKASLGAEIARNNARAILTEILRLQLSPNPDDRRMAILLLEELQKEYEQAARDAVASEKNYSQFLLLTGEFGQGNGKAAPGAANSAQLKCDQVAPSTQSPSELQEALAGVGVDEEEFDRLLAAGQEEKAVELIQDALRRKNPALSQQALDRVAAYEVEAYKDKILAELELDEGGELALDVIRKPK